jgi:hypothetical protein
MAKKVVLMNIIQTRLNFRDLSGKQESEEKP